MRVNEVSAAFTIAAAAQINGKALSRFSVKFVERIGIRAFRDC
jgi:hypothetical protein